MEACRACIFFSSAIMNSPCTRAFSTSPPSSRSRVASAEAQPIGLPPKVVECAPGGQSIVSASAMQAPRGIPEASALAMVMMSGVTLKCSIANILPVLPIPDCTSSMMSMILYFLAIFESASK